jgi:hypothetical protein
MHKHTTIVLTPGPFTSSSLSPTSLNSLSLLEERLDPAPTSTMFSYQSSDRFPRLSILRAQGKLEEPKQTSISVSFTN